MLLIFSLINFPFTLWAKRVLAGGKPLRNKFKYLFNHAYYLHKTSINTN